MTHVYVWTFNEVLGLLFLAGLVLYVLAVIIRACVSEGIKAIKRRFSRHDEKTCR